MFKKKHKTPFEELWVKYWKKEQKRRKQFYKDKAKAEKAKRQKTWFDQYGFPILIFILILVSILSGHKLI